MFISCTLPTCAQMVKKPAVPVALGDIYQPKQTAEAPVPGPNPVLMQTVLNAYIGVIEWHFEMRFTPAEWKEYKKILIDMWNNNEKDRKDINNTYTCYTQLMQMSDNDLNTAQHNGRSADSMDIGMEGILSNGQNRLPISVPV